MSISFVELGIYNGIILEGCKEGLLPGKILKNVMLESKGHENPAAILKQIEKIHCLYSEGKL